MGEVLDIHAIRETLQRAMDRRGIKAKPLAIAAGLNETAVRDVLKRSDNPRVGTLLKLADALEMPVADFFGGRVPLLGKIGAGGSILFDEDPDPETVEAPPGEGRPASDDGAAGRGRFNAAGLSRWRYRLCAPRP
jgi:transcriptional regulator with XRE-family HTH domain